MGKKGNARKATQLLTCRTILTKYLDSTELEICLMELREAMRNGPNSWAFRPPKPDLEKTHIEYTGR